MRDPRVGKAASRFEEVVNKDVLSVKKLSKGKESDPMRQK